VAGHLAEELERIRSPALELVEQRPRVREGELVTGIEVLEDYACGRVVAAVRDPFQDIAVARIEVTVGIDWGRLAAERSPQPQRLVDLES
jgi:hypothetical protein